jgi:hypothetical protein
MGLSRGKLAMKVSEDHHFITLPPREGGEPFLDKRVFYNVIYARGKRFSIQ